MNSWNWTYKEKKEVKVARGSKNENKNRAVEGLLINGAFIHKDMEVEVTGYDQNNMKSKEQVTVRGIIKYINGCYLSLWTGEDMRYIHSHGIKKVVYDFEDDAR